MIRSRFLRGIWLFLVVAVGLLSVFYPTFLSGFRLMQTDPGDTRFNNYILEHSYQWISGNKLHSDFWSPPFFWPERNVAAYSDILLGTAQIYWILRFIGFFPDTSFQLWMVLVLLLNFLAAFVLLRNGFNLSFISCLAGAYVFAFASARVAQLGHQQLLPQFFTVLAIFCFIRAFGAYKDRLTFNRVWLPLTAICCVLQIYAGFYLGWFLVFGVAVFSLCALVFSESRSLLIDFVKNNWLSVVICIAVSAATLSWMGQHYHEAYLMRGFRSWNEVFSMVPRWYSWFFTGGSLFWNWQAGIALFRDLPMRHEHQMGLGAIALIMSAYGYWRFRKIIWVKVILGCSLVIVLLAMVYPWGCTPWKLVWMYFPGAGSVRAVTRICLLMLIPISIGVALGVCSLKRRWLAVAVLIVLCLEHWPVGLPVFDKLAIRNEVASVASSVPERCRSFFYAKVANAPPPWPEWKYQLDAMWSGLMLNKSTLNGYSGNNPVGWDLHFVIVRSNSHAWQLRTELDRWIVKNNLKETDVCLPWWSLLSELAPSYVLGQKLDFNQDHVLRYLGKGWSHKESWGIWTDGSSAELRLVLDEPPTDGEFELFLKIQLFPPRKQKIRVSLNGTQIGEISTDLNEVRLGTETKEVCFSLDGTLLRKENLVVFEIEKPTSPQELGNSRDPRKLGLGMLSFQINRK